NPTFAVRDFTGAIRFTPGSFEGAAVEVTVRADSLELIDKVSDHDRQEIEKVLRHEVLETARFPEIRYHGSARAARPVAESARLLRVEGSLALRGVARDVIFDARLRLFSDGVRLGGEFGLLQSPFGIKPVKAVGGLITVKDELKVAFDIAGLKRDE